MQEKQKKQGKEAPLVLDWMDTWVENYVKPNLAYKTYRCYDSAVKILRRHNPELSKICLEEMDTFKTQCILNSLADNFARSTINSTRVVFHESFLAASEIPSLSVSPLGKLKIPLSAKTKKVRALTRAEQATVEEAAQTVLLERWQFSFSVRDFAQKSFVI